MRTMERRAHGLLVAASGFRRQTAVLRRKALSPSLVLQLSGCRSWRHGETQVPLSQKPNFVGNALELGVLVHPQRQPWPGREQGAADLAQRQDGVALAAAGRQGVEPLQL